ncbi:MAG: hypothetical protein ACRDNS_07640 [Trebonia sp.]
MHPVERALGGDPGAVPDDGAGGVAAREDDVLADLMPVDHLADGEAAPVAAAQGCRRPPVLGSAPTGTGQRTGGTLTPAEATAILTM